MIEVVNKVKCCGCYACYNKCPRKAINMIQDEDGFKYETRKIYSKHN